MDPSELRQLDKLYSLYGYKKEKDEPTARVYLLEQGMYYGAEIVNLKGGSLAKQFFNDYSQLGYACKNRDFKGIQTIKEELFNGFFNIAGSYKRIENRYKRFSEKQVRHLEKGTTYEYVRAPYSVKTLVPFQESGNLVSDVLKILNRSGPGFIIIEAAAGFGKTCTAYEILKDLIKKYPGKRPLFAELSKDRTARIFKHVLLSEIDEEYRGTVNSDLVRYHINSGKIPFIIDGFDELLSKETDGAGDLDNEFDEIETMLTTIGELLKGNAKIILTSRKTAIFSGEKFEKWRESYPKEFEVFRIGIDTPQISDWLDGEKLDQVVRNNRLIKNISNPVLLSLLKFSSLAEFKNLIQNPGRIIQKYFNTILIREQERQNLAILPADQLVIFQKLAGIFTDYNINSEERGFLKDFFKEYNLKVLEQSLDQYPGSNKPTIDEMIDTLTNHALLDRVGTRSDRIGFLNDFIFGTLIGENLVSNNYQLDYSSFPESKAELALSAWRFQDSTKKTHLWTVFENQKFHFSGPLRLSSDAYLKEEILHSFTEEQFDSFSFDEVAFGKKSKFEKCVFINCEFKNCVLDFSVFFNCSAVNSRFINCEISNHSELSSSSISFFACINHGTEGLNELTGKHEFEEFEENSRSTKLNLEQTILPLMFKVGGIKPKWKSISNIINELDHLPQKEILKEIQRLINEKILQELGNGVKLTMDGIVYCNRKNKTNE